MKEQKRLLINLIATAIAFAVQFGVNFILTPYIVNSLGSEAYSYIPIATNFVGYANIVSVAVYSMTSRFVSVEYNKGRPDRAEVFFNSALVSNLVVSLALLIPSILVTLNIKHIINVPDNLLPDVELTFGFAFANMLLTLATSAFGSVYYVTNRLDINAKRNIEGNVLRAVVLIALFSLLPAKIYFLNATVLLVGVYLVSANFYYTHKLMPDIHPDLRKSTWNAIKEMLSSGIWNSFNQASNIMLTTLDLFLANLFAGSVATGQYSVSKTVPNFILSVITMLVGVFVPQLTIYYAKQQKERLTSALSYSIRSMGFLCSFPIGFLLVFGKDFFHLWVPSQDADMLHWLSVLTLIPLAISCCTEVVYNIFTVTNKLRTPAVVLFILGIVNTVAAIVLMKTTSMGIWAVPVVALVISIIRNLVFTPIYASRCLHMSVSLVYAPIVRGMVCTVAMTLVCLCYRVIVHGTGTWFTFLVAAVICSCIAGAANIMVIFDKDERRRFFGMIVSKLHI